MVALREPKVAKQPAIWRTVIFTTLTLLYAVASFWMLEGVVEGLSPWVIIGCPGCTEGLPYHPEWHVWHGAQHGTMIAILFGGALVGLLWKALEKPLLLQFYILGHLWFMGSFMPFSLQPATHLNNSAVVMFVVTLVLIFLAYPGTKKSLLTFKSETGVSKPLLALTALAAVALAWPTWHAIAQQLVGTIGDEHIMFVRWGEDAVVNGLLVVAGLLAATRSPGWKALGLLLGLGYLFLGAAALTVPAAAGSWGVLGGVLSLLGGAAYLAITYTESKQAQA